MTVEFEWAVPETVSFEQAISLTQRLLDRLEQGALEDSAIAEAIGALVRSPNGARGFFVTYLSDERPLADQPTPALITALVTAPDVIAPLLVKNVAMSTAMAITHRRQQHDSLAQGSDRVRSRSIRLIQALQLAPIHEQIQHLLTTIETEQGTYQSFLERWGYDNEQRQAIYQALEPLT